VGVIQRSAVGHVQAPHAHTATGRAQGTGFDTWRITPSGLFVEASFNILQTEPGDDRHTIPLAKTPGGDLVTKSPESLRREIFIPAFGLLHRQDIDLAAVEIGQHPVQPGPDGIDVPGGQAHQASAEIRAIHRSMSAL
jgi:hypothetical protein